MSLLTKLVCRARPLHSIASATPRTLPAPTSRTFSFASLFSSDPPSHSKPASKSPSSTTSSPVSPSLSPSKATSSPPTTESGPVATSRTNTSTAPSPTTKPHHKTPAELDEELRAKMSEMAGDGGASGVEYEDGVPVSMKRSVKNNMFRYI